MAQKHNDGIPGLISGELCFVSNSTSSNVLPKSIIEWLEGIKPQNSDLQQKLKNIQKTKEFVCKSNKNRINFYKFIQQEGPLFCELTTQGVSAVSHQSVSNLSHALEDLDERLIELTLRYALITDAERQIAMSQLMEQARLCVVESKQQLLVQHLGLFCLHLEHETDGGLSLKRLPHAHPQFQRCKKAATENVRNKVFKATNFNGVNVQEVYKIENKALLKDFQYQSSPQFWTGSEEQGLKIKGLFCRVPRESVERVVVYGAHENPPNDLSEVFKKNWLPFSSSSFHHHHNQSSTTNSHHGYAASLVSKGKPLKFPRSFSRYSTLEEDKEFLNEQDINQDVGHDDDDDDDDKNQIQERKGCSNDSNNVMFLALCRVLVGRVKKLTAEEEKKGERILDDLSNDVTSKENSRKNKYIDSDNKIEEDNEDDKDDDNNNKQCEEQETNFPYDALYSQEKEEYTLFKPQFVLPEFLIQFNYIPSTQSLPSSSSSTDEIDSTTHSKERVLESANDSHSPHSLRSSSPSSHANSSCGSIAAVSLQVPHITLPRRFAYDDPSSSSGIAKRRPSSPCLSSSPFTSKTSSQQHPSSEVIFHDGRLLSEREALNILTEADNNMDPSSSTSSSTTIRTPLVQSKSEVLNERLNGQLQRRSIGGAVEKSFELFWQKRDMIQKEELSAIRRPIAPLRVKSKVMNSSNHQQYRIGGGGSGGDVYHSGVFKSIVSRVQSQVHETKYAAAGRRAFLMRHEAATQHKGPHDNDDVVDDDDQGDKIRISHRRRIGGGRHHRRSSLEKQPNRKREPRSSHRHNGEDE